MAKLKINERTVDGLLSEVDHYKKERAEVLRENDSLRADNSMLTEILTDMTNDDSYWNDDPQTMSMRWRVKNLVNNIKNR
jgi:regulator of replication initiation timing